MTYSQFKYKYLWIDGVNELLNYLEQSEKNYDIEKLRLLFNSNRLDVVKLVIPYFWGYKISQLATLDGSSKRGFLF